MSKFLRPNKASLTNAQHYEFINVFISVLTEAGFTAAKITTLVSQLQTTFSDEDRWYMVARTSETIASRDAADKRRDNCYTRLYAIIRAWAGIGRPDFDSAASALIKPFNLYKVKTNAQIDEESGQLDNLINDLSTTEMQAHLHTLDLTWLFQQLVAAHQETKSYRMVQGVEESEKVRGALRSARQACDAIYDKLTYLIEAFVKTADDSAPYEAFIRRWNGTLKIYQDMLDRKSGKPTSGGGGSSEPSNPNTPNTPDSPDNPETPDNPTNPNTPENPDNPDNPGGNNGGNGGDDEPFDDGD